MYVSKTVNIQSTCMFIKPEMNLSNLKFSKDYMNININLINNIKYMTLLNHYFKMLYIFTKAQRVYFYLKFKVHDRDGLSLGHATNKHNTTMDK